ncbi:MAG: TldD/PmbA family protein [Oscillospiraceae bacterium]|jgi:TldD protein|nr:TldD/PmbA family protein [Oscillospiraceae bacterium]
MVKRQLAERALMKALSTGGDFAELFFEDRLNNSITLQGGKVEIVNTGRLHGVGVRLFKGIRSVYSYTNDFDEAGLLACAGEAASALKESVKADAPDIRLTGSIAVNLHPVSKLPGDIGGAWRVDRLRSADAAMKAVSNEITQTICRYVDWDQRVTIANSEGLFTSDRRVYTRVALSAVASDGAENQSGMSGPGAMRGAEFAESLDIEERARKAASMAVTMLRARQSPAGVMPVVIDGGFGGVIFHEACGHSLEATSVARGLSEFAGKVGQKIAADIVTAVDDGTMPGEWGSINIDDEGTPSNRLVLIENGVLKNYMVDKLNARRMGGVPVTGSSRREGYTYAPTSRMRNTYIAAGTDDEDEMIRSMGDGLYAKTMGGGSVNPTTGEFNFAVMEGYLVRDGKVAEPVRGASLIGRGSEILLKIDRVGRDMTMAQGMCGSVSGSVPTNVGQPMIRVSSLTVGGR